MDDKFIDKKLAVLRKMWKEVGEAGRFTQREVEEKRQIIEIQAKLLQWAKNGKSLKKQEISDEETEKSAEEIFGSSSV